jgi:ppGpp synthetase/RelA/SpoT-type nucleotidyltranferase
LTLAGRRIRHVLIAEGTVDIRDLEIVDEFRAWHLPALLEVQQKLSVWLDEGLALGQEELPITSRPKSLEAILAKLERSPISLPRMQDIAGARVVVPGLKSQEAFRKLVEHRFGAEVVRTTDTTESGDQWGYRATHVVVRVAGRLAEIQIRTESQDRWAQIVEALDKARGLDLKHGRGPTDWIQWLQDLSDSFRASDLGTPRPSPPSPFDLLIPEEE